MPILASLNPDCERFSFRVFWIRCAVTVNFTLLALNLRWVARVILFHLRFLFIRLPSSRRCGLAETVGLCFRVDSDRVTLGFVLGPCVCVCVFVLLCSVVVVLFVVGRQQHCRYIVIDAMVYPKNWIWKTSLVLERPQESLDWIWYSYIWFSRQRRFWIWKLRHCAWVDRDEFWMMLYHLLCVLEDVFFFGYLLIMNVIWNMNIFLRIIEYYWYPYMAVMWVDEMSCRKGVWKLDALWEHPLGKGEATCHSS